MLRQSSSRNQRSKGSKVKYALRICLLLAVCFWLIYQVKHSHEKAREFDEDEANDSLDGGLIKLGRKDIHSQVSKYESHDESLEEEGGVSEEEIEENKHVEDRPESKDEDEDGDDELEKLDAGVEREEDFLVDEEEREDDAENETEEKNMEDGSSHEAHEQHYRGDNASSEVSNAHNEAIGIKKEHVDSSDPESILQSWNKENKHEGASYSEKRENSEESNGGGIAKDDKLTNKIEDGGRNVTAGETREIISNASSSANKTLAEIPHDNPDTRKSLSEGDVALNVFADGNNLQTIALGSTKNSIPHGENNLSGSNLALDTVAGAENSLVVGTSIKHATEKNDTPDAEKSYASNGRDETVESAKVQNNEA